MNYGNKKTVAVPKPRPSIGMKNEGLMGSPLVPNKTVKPPASPRVQCKNGQFLRVTDDNAGDDAPASCKT